ALAARDFRVRLIQLPDARPDGFLKGHTGPVLQLKYSPDGSRLATLAADGTVRVWDMQQRVELYSIPVKMAASPQSMEVHFANHERLYVLNEWGVESYLLKGSEVSSEGRFDGKQIQVQVAAGLIGVRHDTNIRILNLSGNRLQAELPAEHGTSDFRFSADGRSLVEYGPTGISVWDTERATLKCRLRGGTQISLLAEFRAADEVITVSRGVLDSTDVRLQRWSIRSGGDRRTIGHSSLETSPGCPSFEQTGKAVAFPGVTEERTTSYDFDGRLCGDAVVGRISRQPQSLRRTCIIEGERVLVWDTLDGRLQASKRFPRDARGGTILAAAAINESDWILLQQNSGPLLFWNLRTDELKAMTHLGGEVQRWAISPQGQWIALATSLEECHLINGVTLESAMFPRKQSVRSFGFDHSGEILAVAGRGAQISVWKCSQQGPEIQWEQVDTVNKPQRMLVAGDGRTVVTLSDNSTGLLAARDSKTGQLLSTASQQNASEIFINRDGSGVAVGTSSGLWWWNLADGGSLTQMSTSPVLSVACPDDRIAVLEAAEGWIAEAPGNRSRPLRTNLRIIHLKTMSAHQVPLTGAGFRMQADASGQYLTISSTVFRVISSNLSDPSHSWLQAEHSAEIVWHAFEPGTGRLLTVSEDGRISAGASDAAPQRLIDAHQSPAVTAAMSPGGDLLATSDRSGIISLWKLPELTRAKIVQGEHAVEHLQFSPDAEHLLSLDRNSNLVIWKVDPAGPEPLTELTRAMGVRCAAWAPRGNRLLLAERQTNGAIGLKITEFEQTLAAGRPLDTGNTLPQRAVFSPDAEQVAVVDEAGRVQVFSADTGQRRNIPATESGVLDVCYTPSGDKLLLICADCLLVRDDAGQSDLIRYAYVSRGLRLKNPLATSASGLISPDGRFFIGVSSDHSAVCWPLDTLNWAERQAISLAGQHATDKHAERAR
ncbi:MAG: hypothetical protein RLZZ536_3164, partial [Planctomycetota bacterium]